MSDTTYTVPELHSAAISDALTCLWHHAPIRRADIEAALRASGGSLWLEGDGPDDDDS